MSETLLRARLVALRRNVTVTHSVASKERTELVLVEGIEDAAWETAFGQLAYDAQQLMFNIDDLEMHLDGGMEIKAAWTMYRSIRDRAQGTCRDCLELVGGFALREKLLVCNSDQLLDKRVIAATEAIAQICRTASLDLRRMLALPAAEDAVSTTMARIVRARFPDWTVWTLPAAAYEYALVVLSEIGPISDAIDAERRLRLSDEKLTERSRGGKRRSSQLQAQLVTLYADAFATRVMGPAYACAMIVLRFDPLRGETEALPSDRDRVATIIEVLRRAYPASADGPLSAGAEYPWRFVHDKVAPSWAALCEDAAALAPKWGFERETPEIRAAAFMNRNWAALRSGILPEALYPYAASFDTECWKNARNLADDWTKHLTVASGQDQPAMPGLRDILNAAWICRIENPDAVRTLTRWTRNACDASLTQKPRVPSSAKPDPRQPDGRPRPTARRAAQA